MTNTWFVMIPPGDRGKSDTQKRRDDFRIQYAAGSKAWKDANAGRVVQGAEGNTGNPQVSEPLVKWKGPFATEAEAKAAQAPIQHTVGGDVANAASSALGNIPGLSAIGDFFSRLTSAHTWLRVAEFIVGGAFLLIGLNHLLGNPAGKVAKAVPKVVPV